MALIPLQELSAAEYRACDNVSRIKVRVHGKPRNLNHKINMAIFEFRNNIILLYVGFFNRKSPLPKPAAAFRVTKGMGCNPFRAASANGIASGLLRVLSIEVSGEEHTDLTCAKSPCEELLSFSIAPFPLLSNQAGLRYSHFANINSISKVFLLSHELIVCGVTPNILANWALFPPVQWRIIAFNISVFPCVSINI